MNIIDNQNISYNIEKVIGEGSQGKTYLLEDNNFIVKLFNSSDNEIRLKSKINFLVQLDLDGEYFAMPKRTIVKPTLGYISEFAKGMISLDKLMRPSEDCQNVTEWLKQTGGIVKRYGVLVRLAWAMRILHSKGLVYCDLSPKNVFVSADPNKQKVMLIDLDNLSYRTGIAHNIFTPYYGAPEVVTSQAPNTVMSDCYSFAVIAYELLTMAHPLIGDAVHDGTPEDEESALAGERPWVDNDDDKSNSRQRGIPSYVFSSSKVFSLFKRNFEDGLNDPYKRPSMGEWFDALSEGFNELLKCGNTDCGMHYPVKKSMGCPFCDKKPEDVVHIQIKRWEIDKIYNEQNNNFEERGTLCDIICEDLLVNQFTPKPLLTTSLLLDTQDWWAYVANFRVQEYCTDGTIIMEINVSENYELLVSTQSGRPLPSKENQDKIRGKKTIRCRGKMAQNKLMFHLFDLSKPQRVIVIDF